MRSNRKSLDVGILMGSSCQEIFDEEVKKSVGTITLKEWWTTERCKCKEPGCFRNFFQKGFCGESKSKEEVVSLLAEIEANPQMVVTLMRKVGSTRDSFLNFLTGGSRR